ncbi:hypothetical protein [Hydrogenimonas urashimensis]|uniref:hypothetical protein n=1 Tax=Hydrogenimonas urashimensis TaxID=2740515 RepID=UPI001915E37F|nr:hypothetical protein [Hydrogenimonas urashimensis]
MKYIFSVPLSTVAFLLLFSAEFGYYLLILQTGIVQYHHSILSEIWTMPVGGMVGLVWSVKLYPNRHWLMPSLLFLQLILSLYYASANELALFLLGLISGLTAPILIAMVPRLWVAVVALAFSYIFSTYVFDVPAIDRTFIALLLSAVAFGASLLSDVQTEAGKHGTVSFHDLRNIFLWLLLDATLFETLSRDVVMHLWGDEGFVFTIIVFHLVGLVVAYHMRSHRHNNALLLVFFALTYVAYASGSRYSLSVIYPFVISYYNVVILAKLIHLPYPKIAVASSSLWAASGLGLLIALSHTFVIAWIVLAALFFNYVADMVRKKPIFCPILKPFNLNTGGSL